MPDLCSTKCEHCHQWRAVARTKRGNPLIYCGVCGYATNLLAKRGIENFKKACQQISLSDLPEPTQKWLKDKIEKEEKEED